MKKTVDYRCEATSLAGFVQQLVLYLASGYWFYVVGEVPERKDPAAVDAKLVERYGVALSRSSRARRKRAGGANVHYIRYGRHFVLLATGGEHRIFEEERERLRDAREDPIKLFGYSVRFREGHVHVRIEVGEYRRLKAYFLWLATSRSAETLGSSFARLSFEPYAPVRSQLKVILRAVNRARKAAGFVPVSRNVVRWRRTIVKPFDVPLSALTPGHGEDDQRGVRLG